jgi:hypothetical protein
MDDPWPAIFGKMRRIFDPNGSMAHSRYEQLWEKDGAAGFANTPRKKKLGKGMEETCIS